MFAIFIIVRGIFLDEASREEVFEVWKSIIRNSSSLLKYEARKIRSIGTVSPPL